jgi:hypothetical protein
LAVQVNDLTVEVIVTDCIVTGCPQNKKFEERRNFIS